MSGTSILTRIRTLWPLGLVALLWPLRRLWTRTASTPRRFLVIQVAKIGDLVVTTGLFRAIKASVPDAHLTVMVLPETRDILQDEPEIDAILSWSPRELLSPRKRWRCWRTLTRERFDACLLTTPNPQRLIDAFLARIPTVVSLVEVEKRCPTQTRLFERLSPTLCTRVPYRQGDLVRAAYQELLPPVGLSPGDPSPRLNPCDESRQRARSWYESHLADRNRPWIGLSPGAGNELKRWPIERFAELARLLQEQNAQVLIVGSPADKSLAEPILRSCPESIDACGAVPLRDLPAFLSHLDLFISVDTGPLYVASAVGVPVVDIVGPIDPDEQPPVEHPCEIVARSELDCFPCSHVFNTARSCHTGHLHCLHDTHPQEVLEAALRLLPPRS